MAIFNSYVSHYQRVYHDIISVTWIFFQFPPTRSWYGHRTTKKAVTKLPAVPKRWHGVDVKHIILPKLRTLLWSIVHPYLTYVYLMLKPCLRPNTLAGEVAGKCFTLKTVFLHGLAKVLVWCVVAAPNRHHPEATAGFSSFWKSILAWLPWPNDFTM